MDMNEILDIFFQVLKDIIEGITLPTGKNLLPAFFFSLGITAVSVLCTILGYFPIIRWQGAVIATVALAILVFIERRGMDEVSRLYRVAKSRAATLAKGSARPSADDEVVRGTNPGDPDVPED